MREALGPQVGLALECHTRYDTESAIQIAKAVEPYRPCGWKSRCQATIRHHGGGAPGDAYPDRLR